MNIGIFANIDRTTDAPQEAGRPPHVEVFVPTGTQTIAVRGWVTESQGLLTLGHGRPDRERVRERLRSTQTCKHSEVKYTQKKNKIPSREWRNGEVEK